VEKRIQADGGRSWLERVRLYSAGDLEAMLRGASIEVEFRFGDYGGGPLSSSSPRVILAGQRA
jgi:hypothetical protein